MSHVQALYERRNAAAGRPQAGEGGRLASAGHATPGASPRKYVSMASTNRVVPPGLRTPSTASRARLAELGVSSEPIRAYLRIRPPGARDAPASPHVHPVSDTEVVMTPPEARSETRARLNMVTAPSKYKFSRVFDGASEAAMGKPAAQSAFFEQTTLPLVKDLLDGKNSLVFTYGVTNSGKTYTVQGGQQPGEAGILPRAIDVVFNSTRGFECRRAIRPVGLSGVQPGVSDPCTSLLRDPVGSATGRRAPAAMRPALTQDDEVDPTKVEVDDHYRYSIWVSYVEVYNERLYDLLNGQALPTGDVHASAPARRPLVLKSEVESGGKYVGGLKEVKVNSIQEAKGLLRRGQENRAVYGTMANHISSRSHSVFTIKVIREHVDVQLDERDVAGLSRKYFISRMSIVDLAGSERIANTDITAGPRLKEAGNINMSLMCLGQCLETMRKNQIRAGIYADNAESEGAASETVRKHTRRQSVIPFRHSKLTGLFQSFFTGDGKVVMIVNVNPYATGYEENNNVMRFSAMAKDVGIHVNPRAPTELSVAELSDGDIGSPSTTKGRRGVHIPGQFSDTDGLLDGEASEASASDEASEVDEEDDEFVRMLVEENERLRLRAERAESLCSMIEASVRDEMTQYMHRSLCELQNIYEAQMREEIDENDEFVDRKIDLFKRLTSDVEPEACDATRRKTVPEEQTRSSSRPRQPLSESHTDQTASAAAAPAGAKACALGRESTATDADGSQDVFLLAPGKSPGKRMRKLGSKPAVQSDDIAERIAQDDSDVRGRAPVRRSTRISLR